MAIISGIYFLFLPDGGFRGGRNPLYGIVIFFQRYTWEDIHTYSGLAMVAAALIHLVIHWKWVWMMTKKMVNILLGRCTTLNRRGILNVLLMGWWQSASSSPLLRDLLFFFPSPPPGGPYPARFEPFPLGHMIHTWAGVTLIAAALVHFGLPLELGDQGYRRFISGLIPSKTVHFSVYTPENIHQRLNRKGN